MKRTLLALALALAGTEAVAFGVEGHAIVGELAERRLTPEALAHVKEILGGNVSLASTASWADDVYHGDWSRYEDSSGRPETARWHYVDIPENADSYDASRDCAENVRGDCVIAAIERERAALSDEALERERRAEALKFLVHFLGDLHQPLHCLETDEGGNLKYVILDERSQKLHAVWDGALIRKHYFNWGGYGRDLEIRLRDADEDVLAAGTVEEWAWGCHELAIEVAYDLPANDILDIEYQERAMEVIDGQLAAAGVRLARILNEALGE